VMVLASGVHWAEAACAWLSVLGNPIGDAADALIEVFTEHQQIGTMLGIEPGTELNVTHCDVDPGQAKVLAAELQLARNTAGIDAVTVSGATLTVGRTPDSDYDDEDEEEEEADARMDGFVALCASLGSLKTLKTLDLSCTDTSSGLGLVSQLSCSSSSVSCRQQD